MINLKDYDLKSIRQFLPFTLLDSSEVDDRASCIYKGLDTPRSVKIEEEQNFNKFSPYINFNNLTGKNSFSFRITLKEYKQGLNASKYSLLLNQFSIEPNNFIFLINEILLNNFPITVFQLIFGDKLEEINIKLHFLVIISKKRPNLSSNNHFFIIPQGLFISQLRAKLWPLFTNKYFYLYTQKLCKINLKKLNRVFILLTYYIYKLIMLKSNYHINCLKFYSKEERQYSIGNYFCKKILSLNNFVSLNLKLPPTEQFVFTSSINEFTGFVNVNFDLNYYQSLKRHLNNKKDFLECLD